MDGCREMVQSVRQLLLHLGTGPSLSIVSVFSKLRIWSETEWLEMEWIEKRKKDR